MTCVLLNQIQLWQQSEHRDLRSTFSGTLLLHPLWLFLYSLPAFAEVYRSWFLTVIHVRMWTPGILTGGGQASHAGCVRRRFWAMSGKSEGVLHLCFHPNWTDIHFWFLPWNQSAAKAAAHASTMFRYSLYIFFPLSHICPYQKSLTGKFPWLRYKRR